MELELRVASAELIQLALWLQMLSRAEDPPTEEQIDLVIARCDAGLRRVKIMKSLNGDGETPDY